MVERGCGASFPFEALQRVRFRSNLLAEHFDRDVATELEILGPVNFTHAARAERRDDLIRAELGADSKGHNSPP